jgi:peptide/nickel transport system permease protein
LATADPTILGTPTGVDVVAEEGVLGRSPTQLFWLRFRREKLAFVGLGFIIFLVILAFTAPLISRFVAHHGPNQLFQNQMTTEIGLPKGPNGHFWFGADQNGRDIFVRVIYGTQTSLLVSVVATGIAIFIGVVVGIISGFFRGWVDTAISRVIDIMLALPLLLFAIGIVAACSVGAKGCLGGLVKQGRGLVIFVIALFSWTYIARVIRGQVLTIRERQFVEASRSLGASNRRIMFSEILPNLVAPIIILATLAIPANILFEAYLSYLGLGVPPEVSSWGRMISDATHYYQVAWWLMLFPGLFLLLTTLSFNLLGDGLRDALDPRSGR